MFFKPIILKIIFALLLLIFLLLSILIAYHPILPLDVAVSTAIQKYHSDSMDQLMLAISFFGEIPYSLILVLLVAGIFFYFKYRVEAYFIAMISLSGLLILGIKNIINRPRPTGFYVRLVEVFRFQSYPSGHVLSYVLFFGFLIVLMYRLKEIPSIVRKTSIGISIFLLFTVSPSRIYLGAHWFTDTVGGFLLGLICLFPLCYYYFKQRDQLKSLNQKPRSNNDDLVK